MKQLILIFLILGSCQGFTQSPFLDWIVSAGGIGTEYGFSVATDEANNIYVSGGFSMTIDIDPGSNINNLISNSAADYYVAKFTSQGELVWAKSGGGYSNEWSRVITYENGSLYLGTMVSDTSFIDLGDTIIMAAQHEMMIEKMDTSGTTEWLRFIDADLGAEPFGMTVDGSGNLYTVGYFYGNTDFDPGAAIYTLSSTGSTDAFVLKLDSSGNFLWAKVFPSSSHGYAYSVACDTNDNVLISGDFTGSIDLDPGGGLTFAMSSGERDMYISKLDSSGNFIWGRTIGGTSYDGAYSLTTDNENQIYVCGNFREETDFDPGSGTYILNGLGWLSDAFLLKLDDGGNFVWAHAFGSPDQDMAHSLTFKDSALYMTGGFYNTIDFDPGPSIHELTASNLSLFVLKLNTDGEYLWATTVENQSNLNGEDIAVDNQGAVLVIGDFNNTIFYGPYTGEMNLEALGDQDMVLFKFAQCTPSPLAATTSILDSLTGNCNVPYSTTYTATNDCGIVFYGEPNPFSNQLNQGTNVVTWTYSDGYGNTLSQTQIVIWNDTTPPFPIVPNLPDISDECPIALEAPAGHDWCAGSLTGTPSLGAITTPGVHIVVWTYTDDNGNTFTQNQTFTYTPINDDVIVIDGALESQAYWSYSHQWLDCDNGMVPIPGANEPTFIPPDDGSYAVRVSNGQCYVVSDCMSFANHQENTIPGIVIYPNPITTELFVSNSSTKNINLKLFDSQGKLIISQETEESITTINTVSLPNGFYYLEIKSLDVVYYVKVVK